MGYITKQHRFSISGHWQDVKALAFSTDSKTLVSGIPHATIHKWDIDTGRLISTLAGRYGEQILAFDMNRDLFASRSSYLEKTIKFMSVMLILVVPEHHGLGKLSYNQKATFSHDGDTLVLTHWGLDGVIKYCDRFSERIEFEFVPNENPEFRKPSLNHQEGYCTCSFTRR